MELTRDQDIDPAPLIGKRVAVLGFGNQGRAQSLNLHDSGIDVVVGLRGGSESRNKAEAAGVKVDLLEQAAASADVAMLLAPDEILGDLYAEISRHLRPGTALGFSHGLAVHFGLVRPRDDLDVFLVAPKGPGTALRSLYRQGKGMAALWAVAQDASGEARGIALAYGRAIGCGRAGLIESSFEEEAVADLFNENAVVWGGVPELLRAGFETLVEAGISPEVAYLECVGELKLLAELIDARGIAGMREAISNTAELGAVLGGPAVVTSETRERMEQVLDSVRSGRFASALREEAKSGYPRLSAARQKARSEPITGVYEKVKNLSADD
ncbi:MAG TPA: ketol-acid reductoisomerase [Sphingomicrobium sp.]|nr:ketol-acid reductoisomerase [Sphingomicrobium sp.]